MCFLCMEEVFQNGSWAFDAVQIQCGHIFHEECLLVWATSSEKNLPERDSKDGICPRCKVDFCFTDVKYVVTTVADGGEKDDSAIE